MSMWYYNGAWPNQTRYDFPGALLPYIAVAVALHTLSRLVARGFGTAVVVAGAAALLLWGFSERHDLTKLRKLSTANRERTQAFTGKINRIIETVSRSPQTPVVLEAYAPGDFEPAGSVASFLHAGGVDNPMQLRVAGFTSERYARGTLEHVLTNDLEAWMRKGDRWLGMVPYTPTDGEVFIIGLSPGPEPERPLVSFSLHDR